MKIMFYKLVAFWIELLVAVWTICYGLDELITFKLVAMTFGVISLARMIMRQDDGKAN